MSAHVLLNGPPVLTHKLGRICSPRCRAKEKALQSSERALILSGRNVDSLVHVDELQIVLIGPLIINFLTHSFHGLFDYPIFKPISVTSMLTMTIQAAPFQEHFRQLNLNSFS